MNKKVTIKDVAEAAGVCKATFSYVLNDRKDQKISEETKKKIWQVVNMLGYRPNAFAQNMRVCNERLLIGVCIPDCLSELEKLLCFDFLSDYLAASREDNANIVLLDSTPERISTADAVVAFSPTRSDFFALGECNFIPILSVDCRIDDSLFFEVSLDYRLLKRRAEEHFGAAFRYVCIPPRDELLRKEIESAFPDVLFVRHRQELESLPAGNLLLSQKCLLPFLSRDKHVTYCPEDLADTKMRTIASCVRSALSHEPCEKHIFKV